MFINEFLRVSGSDGLGTEPIQHLFLNVLPIDLGWAMLFSGTKGRPIVLAAADAAKSAQGGSLEVLGDVLGRLEVAARN